MAQAGPGKGFRDGMSIVEVIRMFPDDGAAERWFAEARWPYGVWCPHCVSLNVQTGAKHKSQPYRCRDCRKRFSVKTNTAMHDSKLGIQVWAIATYLMTTGLKGTASMKLHRDLGVTQKTAWHLGACPRFDVVGKHWGDGEWSCRDFGCLAHGWLPSGAWRGERHDWSRRLMALGRRRAWPGCGRCRSSPIRM